MPRKSSPFIEKLSSESFAKSLSDQSELESMLLKSAKSTEELVKLINSGKQDEETLAKARDLIENGFANVDALSDKLDTKVGDRLIHTAVRNGNDKMVGLLVEYGCDVNARNKIFQLSPLHLAVSGPQDPENKVLHALLKAKDIDYDVRDDQNVTPGTRAAALGNYSAFETIAFHQNSKMAEQRKSDEIRAESRAKEAEAKRIEEEAKIKAEAKTKEAEAKRIEEENKRREEEMEVKRREAATAKKEEGMFSMFLRKIREVGEMIGFGGGEKASLLEKQKRSDEPPVETKSPTKKIKMEELVVGDEVVSPLHQSSSDVVSKLGESDKSRVAEIMQSLKKGNSKTVGDEVKSPLHSHVDSVNNRVNNPDGMRQQ